LPALLDVRWQADRGFEAVRTLVRHAFTFLTMLSALLAATRLPASTLWEALCAGAFAAYAVILWGLFGYWWWTGHQFDVAYALDAGGDAASTVLRSFGFGTLGFAALVTLAFGTAVAWGWFGAARWLRVRRWSIFPSWSLALPLVLELATVRLALGERPLVWAELGSLFAYARGTVRGAPIFPEWPPLPPLREESVFILQLESGNALATSGELEFEGRRYEGDFVPQLRKIARSGVWFPYAWANSVQTNRALENILCGIDHNTGQALSYTPHKIVTPCLPALLRSAGYRTLLFVGFDDLGFMNYRNFASVLGFEEIWDATLAGRSTMYDWGIDDCTFYRAVFDHLRAEHRGEKLFVYVEVSSHHYPFSGYARYASLHPFPLPRNTVEWFLNSWVEQDFCVAEFYRLFREFAPSATHLWITPDHAWPVGLHGNTLNDAGWYNENFLVPLLYVPPQERQQEFRVGEVVSERPGLSDLPATVLDLLTDQFVGNSFAHLLRREGDAAGYEDCHLLVQPYGRRSVAVVRGKDKWVYHFRDQTLEFYDLETDPRERSPAWVTLGVSFEEVRERFYCRRHLRSHR